MDTVFVQIVTVQWSRRPSLPGKRPLLWDGPSHRLKQKRERKPARSTEQWVWTLGGRRGLCPWRVVSGSSFSLWRRLVVAAWGGAWERAGGHQELPGTVRPRAHLDWGPAGACNQTAGRPRAAPVPRPAWRQGRPRERGPTLCPEEAEGQASDTRAAPQPMELPVRTNLSALRKTEQSKHPPSWQQDSCHAGKVTRQAGE